MCEIINTMQTQLDSHTMNWIGYGDGLEYHGVVECEKATFQEIHDAKIDNIALANGYVKAEDLDAIKAHVDEQVLDCIEDAHLRVERLRDEDFGAVAALKGYIRLAPDEVVVKRATAEHAREVLVCEVSCSKSGDDEVCPECEYAITDLTAALNREVNP